LRGSSRTRRSPPKNTTRDAPYASKSEPSNRCAIFCFFRPRGKKGAWRVASLYIARGPAGAGGARFQYENCACKKHSSDHARAEPTVSLPSRLHPKPVQSAFSKWKKCTEIPKSATAQPYGKISLVGYFESVLPLASLPRRALRHYSPRADPARPGNAAARLVPASREALRERSRSRDPAPRTFATPRATSASEIPHRPGREKARSAHVASPPPFR
jgi:hypothetical protein